MRSPFAGKRLTVKIKSQVSFVTDKVKAKFLTENSRKAQIYLLVRARRGPAEVLNTITLLVWTGKQHEKAKNASPVQTELKLRAMPVWVPQYRVSFAARGLELLADKFLWYGLI